MSRPGSPSGNYKPEVPGHGRQRRQRRAVQQDAKDRWMITYADLITLLLIFFVIMYAMSRLDAEKYEVVTQSLQMTFSNGNSILDKGAGITGSLSSYNAKTPSSTAQNGKGTGSAGQDGSSGNGGQQASAQAGSGQAPLTERELAFRKQEQELSNLMQLIEAYIKENSLEDQIHVADLPKGISITLSDRFLFDTGKADLKSGSAKTLSKLASLFGQLDTVISIEGHTDSQPIGRSSKFKDNWELSGARALSVLRFFVDKEALDPQHFQYAGYADTRPAAGNDTAAGRQKNRRVEITVLRQLQQ
ncbi:MAG: flagellar motor protein MotB [Paenibacillus macerans]|uniref:Membrane MotB of proton-channel complex MotA/MotB family protein n=1 Tax=Paenibacillus macerans TaxID=44252 RepID=A0A090ZBZ7_PAEMA|nr:flagellar motor protein MotB [Paenibacillus macerans]KFN07740.1 membrane MotB of proton-channel complex MotA/MotB family protein [Paenibacillus macerans]MBS5914743.1 OmpA family protein [Paenibacillus macerans]MDU5947766.1 flagellar motor protein MotB [Paenibacillus macerans]MDU7474348.1 flagellar motor protein MotB [Paenibacillus macerans]MEC0150474.1 flagellar motor protein MotB [Paenibacillus macerans]